MWNDKQLVDTPTIAVIDSFLSLPHDNAQGHERRLVRVELVPLPSLDQDTGRINSCVIV